MKEMLHAKVKQVRTNPAVGNAVKSMKPDRNVWGFLGVVLFFIVPEIIAFIWGGQITSYAQENLAHASSSWTMYYEALVFLFEEGGSWINLLIGVAFLVWLFF